jgi:hypothetical protein
MGDAFCRDCQRFKTQITHFQGRVYATSRKLNDPNTRYPEKELVHVNDAKAQLAYYKDLLEQHEAEHVED